MGQGGPGDASDASKRVQKWLQWGSKLRKKPMNLYGPEAQKTTSDDAPEEGSRAVTKEGLCARGVWYPLKVAWKSG